jgi:hypothetical protein
MEGDCHVIPFCDTKAHDETRDCWCRPEVVDGSVVIHNSLDRRELYEESVQ